jgi:hypothetical protein
MNFMYSNMQDNLGKGDPFYEVTKDGVFWVLRAKESCLAREDKVPQEETWAGSFIFH